ncbi:MAG: hypothetical protein DLM64_09495 [Solirubrobacterales bacterium]|nr:MAG: hypothetical protein DLM63_06565 [Solirubrobacterales bacterium]PZS10032.1 MAG: hypothetical protein DLM64_09495 [Solirubrobacterales bacterium]
MKAAVPFNAADVANLAKANPYLQRLIDDDELRDNLRKAAESSKSAYERLANGKAPAKTLINDKKLQGDLRDAIDAIRDATIALSDAPKRRRRKARNVARLVLVAGAGGGAALAVNEKMRSKVLDKLFGSEEEFQYTPPAA